MMQRMSTDTNNRREVPVVIVGYDPNWPDVYQAEQALILDAIGPHLAALEHVGSTSVPGLAAKPVIDMMAGLRKLADAQGCIGPLAALGYAYRPEYEARLPERRYFVRPSFHLHVVERSSDFWVWHLAFRDALRADPRYALLKRRLAACYGADREGYTEAKSVFIRSVEARTMPSGPVQNPS